MPYFKPKLNTKRIEFRFDMSKYPGPRSLISDLCVTKDAATIELKCMGLEPQDVCLIGCQRDQHDPDEVVIAYLLVD